MTTAILVGNRYLRLASGYVSWAGISVAIQLHRGISSALCVLRYLKGTRGMVLPRPEGTVFRPQGYSDADYAGDSEVIDMILSSNLPSAGVRERMH